MIVHSDQHFEDNYLADTLIVATVLSHDLVHPSDVAAMNGASAALAISDIPFYNPLGGVRVGRIDGEFTINPSPELLSIHYAFLQFFCCSMIWIKHSNIAESLLNKSLMEQIFTITIMGAT